MLTSVAPATGPLLSWLDRPRADTGVHWLEGGSWEFHPYTAIAARVHGVSAQLREHGVAAGDVVGVAEDSCIGFLSCFFGAAHAGAAALPIPPPRALRSRYLEHVARIARAASTRLIIASAGVDTGVLQASAGAGGASFLALEEVRASPVAPSVSGPLALVHFTSGSTGFPRGVEITRENLEANIRQIDDWLDVGPSDSAASWLPWHHDMGLVGMLLASAVRQTTLWQMRPRDFLRNPVRWLDCFGRERATFAAAPTFAYSFVTRRVKPSELEGQDFSTWRSAVVGAERLEPRVLTRFAKLLAPHGFSRDVIRPAYGLAEATLAVTGQRPGSAAKAVRLGSHQLRVGEPVGIEATASFDEGPSSALGTWLATSGEPLPGVELAVVAEDGGALPERTLGEITVGGPSVAAGYCGETDGINTRFADDRLWTGDAGFFHDGELYVVGRMGDSIKVRGRTVYSEGLEIAIAESLDLAIGQCVVISSRHTRSDAIVAVVELAGADTMPGGWVHDAAQVMRSHVGPTTDISIYGAPPGTIPRTTSGKPCRRALWHAVASLELAADLQLLFPQNRL